MHLYTQGFKKKKKVKWHVGLKQNDKIQGSSGPWQII